MKIPAAVIFFLLGAGTAQAQITLSGDVFDGQGGPLLTGVEYVSSGDLSVPAGETLTVEPGAILKFANATSIEVAGTLQGSAGATRTEITSLLDDSVGGDSGGDGPTNGVPGAWGGLQVVAGGVLALDDARVAFGGGVAPAVSGEGGSIELRNCLLTDNSGAGLDGLGGLAPLVVEDCEFANNTGWAVFNVRIEQLPGFSGNTASGNGLGDSIQVAFGDIVQDTDLVADNLIDGTFVMRSSLNVPAGVTVGLDAGVVIKTPPFAIGAWGIDGTLNVTGTEADPVVFTSLADDSAGGDTTNDGPTVGSRGDWGGLRVNFGGALDATGLAIRNGGVFGIRALVAGGGELTLNSSQVSNNEGPGLDLNSQTTGLAIRGCSFDDNTGIAIENAAVTSLPGLDNNSASGNLEGDVIRASLAPVDTDTAIGPRNLLNGVLVVPGSGDLLVLGGQTLTLGAGTIFKWETPAALDVLGRLDANGTASRPVVLTSIGDDDFGGDSGADGLTSGAPGDTRGLRIPVEGSARLENLRVRYAGAGGAAAVLVDSPTAELIAVRADHSNNSGIRLVDLGPDAVNLIADNNAQAGILVEGGAGNLLHVTSANNGDVGLGRTASYTGLVRSSIVWGNGQDLDQFTTGQIFDSIAASPPAGDNNLDADPLFVDAASGDLRLQAGSPAIDSADLLTGQALLKDADENSRVLSLGFGTSLPDRGALEAARWNLALGGQEALGSTIDFTVTGDPGVAILFLGETRNSVVFDPYGVLLADLKNLFQLNAMPVGVQYDLAIPVEPMLIGRELSVQAFVVDTAIAMDSQLTNVQRLVLQPELP